MRTCYALSSGPRRPRLLAAPDVSSLVCSCSFSALSAASRALTKSRLGEGGGMAATAAAAADAAADGGGSWCCSPFCSEKVWGRDSKGVEVVVVTMAGAALPLSGLAGGRSGLDGRDVTWWAVSSDVPRAVNSTSRTWMGQEC